MTAFGSRNARTDERRSSAIDRRPRLMLPLRCRWLFGLGSIALFLITLVLFYEPILLTIGDFLVVKEDKLQPADMIHVLGGGFDRVDYGVELYHQGYAQRLFTTGCDCTKYQERAMAGGVRPEDLAPDLSWSTTTYEEALELQEFLEGDESIRSVIIVSSPYHMRRAQWSFKKVLGERVKLQFAPVPFEMTSYQQQWWTQGWSRKLVMKEYLGILIYYVRYQLVCQAKMQHLAKSSFSSWSREPFWGLGSLAKGGEKLEGHIDGRL